VCGHHSTQLTASAISDILDWLAGSRCTVRGSEAISADPIQLPARRGLPFLVFTVVAPGRLCGGGSEGQEEGILVYHNGRNVLRSYDGSSERFWPVLCGPGAALK